MLKYILFADAKSPHTLKWYQQLLKFYDVYVVSLNGFSSEFLKQIKKNRIYILNNEVNKNGKNYKLLFKYIALRRIVLEIKPDIINAHYLSSYGLLAAFIKRQYPEFFLIQSAWGSDILIEPFRNKLRYHAVKYSLNKADMITSDSFYMSNIIEKMVPKKEIITFAFGLNSIETSVYEKQHMVFSNRALSENYNIETIIRWFKNQEKIYSLIIANEGIKEVYLKKLVNELKLEDRVQFVGFLSTREQIQYYKKAKYYISIPSSDATSVSLLEAMNYGCIPIISNIHANREWILNNINGIFFKKELLLSSISFNNDILRINRDILMDKGLFPRMIKQLYNRIAKVIHEK